MKINVSGRRMTVTTPIREYIEQKVSRVGKVHDSDELFFEVVISHDRNPAIPNHNHVEITGFMRDYTVRVEEAAPDMYAAIDIAVDRLENQLRKFKTRILARRRDRGEVFKTAPGTTQVTIEFDDAPAGQVVRDKQLESVSMSQDEAILHMELLGHDFFVFKLEGTEESAVVYRRAAGDYGMLRMG